MALAIVVKATNHHYSMNYEPTLLYEPLQYWQFLNPEYVLLLLNVCEGHYRLLLWNIIHRKDQICACVSLAKRIYNHLLIIDSLLLKTS